MGLHSVNVNAARSVLELLAPFPVVLVSTATNVLTIGQLAYFSFRPLLIGIGVARTRFSHALIRAEREFVINVPDAGCLDAVKLCGKLSGRDGDKFRAAGLTPRPSLAVGAVSVSECRAWIECRLEREIEFAERTWFVGEVIAAQTTDGFHGADALLCGRAAYTIAQPPLAQR